MKVSSEMDGQEVGQGTRVKGNDSSPMPQEDPSHRMDGEPVEIKHCDDHKGFGKETAPTVKASAISKPKNAKQDLKTVAPGSNKSALMNKSIGPEGIKSPLGSTSNK